LKRAGAGALEQSEKAAWLRGKFAPDDILVCRRSATVARGGKRTICQRHFEVQLSGGH